VSELLYALAGFVLGLIVRPSRSHAARAAAEDANHRAESPPRTGEEEAVASRPHAPSAGAGTEEQRGRERGEERGKEFARGRVLELCGTMGGLYQQSAHPSDMLVHECFAEALALLGDTEHFTTRDLLDYYAGDNAIVSLVALEALAHRPRERALVDEILRHVNTIAVYPRWFALRAIEHHAGDDPILVHALRQLRHWDTRIEKQSLIEFVERRLAAGETPQFEGRCEASEWLTDVLDQLDRPPTAEFAASFRRLLRTLDVEFLAEIGTVRTTPDAAPTFLDPAPVDGFVDEIVRALQRRPRRSTLVVGEPGVGKSSCIELVTRTLLAEGWTVLEAGSSDILAGQSYMGELEKRLRKLVENLGDEQAVWVCPDLHRLVLAGQHRFSDSGVLDLILPHVESGRLAMVGEVTPNGHERLLRERPRVRSAFDTVVLRPLPHDATLALAGRWAQHAALPDGRPVLDAPTLEEASALARQYLGDVAPPGNLLRLLELARQLAGGSELTRPLGRDDLIATLGNVTGLPSTILDDREGLDLDALRAHFEARVKGQPEAIDVLVERVAMIKAGLTDPGRPQGVFLLVGPTGTGKTEIAKSLAAFLFGSEQRMVRIDMSELQSIDALDRIVGTNDPMASGEGGSGGAFVHEIRKQPFTVVLLDEVEKAHPKVFDLFLQVFDDGRLTDRFGRTADCRHAIFILTSNLGAEQFASSGLAFGGGATEAADRAIRQHFRPEFLNRIDRVIRFRSLSRATLREVLMKELDRVLGRRGLRNRQWAVEWDPTAVDFLLQQGYTPDLGARPLRRAIERWLLAPLAETIVRHEAPEGDQFLFVKSDGRGIEVDFVDPDAPTEAHTAHRGADGDTSDGSSLRRIALDAVGTRAEIEMVAARCALVAERVQGEEFRREKTSLLDMMGRDGFWEDEGRFAVLGRAETMDRIENATRSAGGLLERLTGAPVGEAPRRERCDGALLGQLAQRVWLLEQALADLDEQRGADAVLAIEVLREPRTESARAARAFAERLLAMYRHWAERRGMDFHVLEQGPGSGESAYDVLIAEVGGFAAHRILAPEHGLHVYEQVNSGGDVVDRLRVRVTVAAHDGRPPAHDPGARRRQARALLDGARGDRPEVCRRYREEPSPLVRDNARGFRTGRVDRVFAGDFDLV
jgi:ATP-dependent Clp protease ATP-binding subunit ClpC